MILSARDVRHLLLLIYGLCLLGGASVAVVAVLYAPLPDALAAIAGLVVGTAVTWWLSGHPDLSRYATRRKRAGRWVPEVGDWSWLQLRLAVAVVLLMAAGTATVSELAL